jgi:hypothetical protein
MTDKDAVYEGHSLHAPLVGGTPVVPSVARAVVPTKGDRRVRASPGLMLVSNSRSIGHSRG